MAPVDFKQALRIALGLGLVFLLFRALYRRTPPLVPDPVPVRSLPGWGSAYDPMMDCHFRIEDQTVSIEVPGTLHDLSAEQRHVEAPRVIQAREGDFVAQVRVAGTVQPEGDRTCAYAYPYHGAGLVVWQDSNNYVRLERAAIQRGTQWIRYINFERRREGRLVRSQATSIADAPLTLRLERQGDRLLASFSPDGERWTPLPEMEFESTQSVRVGVAAMNTATTPFTAVFEHFSLGEAAAGPH